MASVSKRIFREIEDLESNQYKEFTYGPCDSDVYYWKATINGPVKSRLAGFKFEIGLTIPQHYPLRPPMIQFLNTKSITCTNVCSDLLVNDWSPALTIDKVILSILCMLYETPKEKLRILASTV